MSDLDTQLAGIFRDESTQRLDQMDSVLLAIESGQADDEAVDTLFRHAHTIKGGAAMLGLSDIRALAHAAEDVLARVREAGVLPPELAAPLLRVTATLRAMVSGSAEPIGDLLDDLASHAARWGGDAGAAAELSGETTELDPQRPPEPSASESYAPEAWIPEARIPEAAEARLLEPAAPHRAGQESVGQESAGPMAAAPAAAPPPPPTVPAPGRSASAGSARSAPAGTASAGPPAAAPAAESAAPAGGSQTLRVPAAKIDHLLDVAGEIMQYRRLFAHALGEARLSQDFSDMLGAGERMLDELKDTAVGMRTLPLAAITGPLPRAIRDLARDVGKDVDFVITGAETELDRVILESLLEPLTHLLRNAVVHGIESPAERELAGKPARGRVELHGVPRGSQVEIMVSDDGKGVSADVIEDARREGALTDVLTRPGYSTAEQVTDLAGRGVGLDAVKAYVNSLGGSLEIRSEPGHGMDVLLLLPLALALNEVLLFERADAVYGIPLPAVEEVVTAAHTLMLQGQPSLEIRGKSLPVTDLAALIGCPAPPLRERSPAIVVSAGGHRTVTSCDALLGTEEVVVKSLGPILAGVHGYIGASILGDGRIALLLEPAALASPRPAGIVAPGVAATSAAPSILVVEDSFTVRELQRSILEAAGYLVITARDGREALTVLERDPDIGLVITDLEMPELDGLGLTRAIRADAKRSSLPVVVVTTRDTEEDRRRGSEAGADAYMSKRSFDQQTLLATVERLIGR
jgi:two-component system, chemotaxis family, sensor kinase CheA